MADPKSKAPKDLGQLGRKLQYLRETVRKEDGSRLTYREILERVEANGGPALSIGYLSQLMNGERDNPGRKALVALAKAYGQDLSYFDDEPGAQARQELITQLESAGVEEIAERAVGLNKGNIDAVKSLLDHLRLTQGLPPVKTKPNPEDAEPLTPESPEVTRDEHD